MRQDDPSPARKKKTESGCYSPGFGQWGAAARPLDGGVLTRWGARASARGPATAPWLPRSSALISRPRCLAVDALRGEENGERESIEREEGGANELGFSGEGACRPFDRPDLTAQPSDEI